MHLAATHLNGVIREGVPMKTKDEIMQLIEEEDVEFVRLQFTDIFGRLKNIAVTPGQMERVFNNRYSFAGSAAFGDRFRYDGKLFLYPDLDTFMILPWRPQQGKVAKVCCDICMDDGTPFEMCSRHILKRTLAEVSKKGYEILIDPENEFFLFHTDENGLPTTTTHEMGGYMDVGPVDFGENARRDIVLTLEEMGFEIESSHHEHAPAQHEIDFAMDEAFHTADAIQTFRFAVRSIAKRFGLYATFMPKPKAGVAGSGMHTNMVLLKDGKEVFRTRDGQVTEEAYSFIAGILKHAKALAAIANPTVNSYKRLNSGYEAPNTISWSTTGENALVKLDSDRESTKVELRFPDGSANPYLLFACAIAAGIDGIEKGEKLCPECAVDEAERYPEDLKEAIAMLQLDPVITETLGADFVKTFSDIKRAEWKDYMMEISDWEINRYLTRI